MPNVGVAACAASSDGSDSEEYFEHRAAASSQGTAGDALFRALRGTAPAAAFAPRQHLRRKRSTEDLLRDAIASLATSAAASSQELDATSTPTSTRHSVLIRQQRDVSAQYLVERDVAASQGLRGWAIDWAMREHPDLCRTIRERDSFLENVQRWATNAKAGAYGLITALSLGSDHDAGDSGRPALSQVFEQGRSGQGSAIVLTTPSKRRRLFGGGGPGS